MPAIPIIALVISAAGAYASYDAGQKQAKATERTAKYNAKVQENEAIQADMEAREQIERTRKENKRLLASQRNSIAGSGIEMTGSPLEVLGANAATLELNALDQARAASLGVTRGYATASATRWKGQMEAQGIKNQANATLLSDAGRIGMQGYNSGVFGKPKA